MISPNANASSYRKDIDGLRAIAVISVVVFHTGLRAMSGGFVGVDIFFVISGYLIGGHIFRDATADRFRFDSFYQKRAKRILPALFAVLLFCYCVAPLLLPPVELWSFGDYAITTVLSGSNILAANTFDYFAKTSIDHPLLMTWSLGVEEQFYIFVPIVIVSVVWFTRKFDFRKEYSRQLTFAAIATLALLSLGLCLWTTEHARMHAFFLLPSRAWELAAGALMAIYEARPSAQAEDTGKAWSTLRSAVGLVALLLAIFYFNPSLQFPGLAAALPVVGTVSMLSAPRSWLNRNLLSFLPLRWVGWISYSWYLWHWPLLSFASIVVAETLPTHVAFVITFVALALAWISWRFVERPFRVSSMAARPLLWRYGIAAIAVLLPGLAYKSTHGLPHRYPVVAAQDEALALDPHSCFGHAAPDRTQECWPGNDGRPAVALYGDSHAAALAPAMREKATRAGMRLVVVVHTSCPPLLNVVRQSDNLANDRECMTFNRRALEELAADKSVTAVFLTALWAGPVYDPTGFGYSSHEERNYTSQKDSEVNLEQGLEAAVLSLKSSDKRVVLLEDNVPLSFDPADRLTTSLMPVRRRLASFLGVSPSEFGIARATEMFTEANASANQVLKRVAQRQAVELFDLAKYICPGAPCTYFRNGVLLYRDRNHLSRAGAQIALQDFPIRFAD